MVKTVAPIDSTENRILAALPEDERNSLLADLEPVTLSFRQILCRQGEEAEYVYFPLDSVMSVACSVSDGRSIELAMVGCEGLTAAQSIFGSDPKLCETVVQVAGAAVRIKLGDFREKFHSFEVLPNLLLQYIGAFYGQIAQVAACHHLHKLEQRLQTWLAMMFNRIKSNELLLTQDDIANTLSYSRPSLTEASIALQKQGIIRYSRGRIRLLDGQRLEESACECRSIMETQFNNVFNRPLAHFSQMKNKEWNINFVTEKSASPTKKLDNVDDHVYLTERTIERIKQSCLATEAYCREQLDLIRRQREEFKLFK